MKNQAKKGPVKKETAKKETAKKVALKKGTVKKVPLSGRFLATDLTLNLIGSDLVAGCGSTGFIDMAQEKCGQNTAFQFVLPVTTDNLATLKANLQEVLKNLEAIK